MIIFKDICILIINTLIKYGIKSFIYRVLLNIYASEN